MNNAEKLLVENLNPTLLEFGFKWIRAREIYVRQESYGFSSFCWASHSTHAEEGRLEVTPIVGVRHNFVENIVNKLGLVYGDDNQRYTTTVEQGLGYFPLKKEKTYTQYIRLISAEKDIVHAVAGLTDIIAGEGRGFFERYSSLLACSQGLNEPIESKSHALCNNFPRRAYNGIAAASFSEKNRVPDLVNRYLRFAKDILPNQYDAIEKKIRQLISVIENTNIEVSS